MSRSYRYIQQYENEILKLKEEGYSQREIGEEIGFSKEQIKEFLKRYRRNQAKIAAEISLKRKGRPRKNGIELPPSLQQLSKVRQLQYELASKERYIKRLEMENKLMRNFLLVTGRE